MASDRPDIHDGFLGAQPRFSELGLQTDSHKTAEFSVKGDHEVVIKLRAKNPVKVVTKLTHVESDRDVSGHVLVQRRSKNSIQFHVSFPENGWFKFLIFALEESDPSDSLPNVYNYLINVTEIEMPALGYGKLFTKFYTDCCYLDEPLVLNSNSDNMDKVKFSISVPGAEKVAVHCVQEWFHLSKNEDQWEGSADLAIYKGKDSKVKIMATYEKGGTSYSALVEYII